MKLWNESNISAIKPTLKVLMPDGRIYEGKILHTFSNFALIRVDRRIHNLNPFSWSRFQLSLGKVAESLNNNTPIHY